MSVLNPVQVCDCQTIVKTFEGAAAYCPTHESVYAMLTPLLQNNLTNLRAYLKQNEVDNMLANPRAGKASSDGVDPPEQSDPNLNDLDNADENDPPIGDKIYKTVRETRIGDDIYDSLQDNISLPIKKKPEFVQRINLDDCIPCRFRLNSLGELLVEAFASGGGKAILDAMEAMFRSILQQYNAIKDLFEGVEKYADICAFWKWMTEYVCLPDLARIVAVLMALLNRIAFDLGGVLGILLSIIIPLIQPFLLSLVSTLEKVLLLIFSPIECIVNSLQELLSKLDVEKVIINNMDATQIPVKWRRQGKKVGQVDIINNEPPVDVGPRAPSLYDRITGLDTNNPTQPSQTTSDSTVPETENNTHALLGDEISVDLHEGPSRIYHSFDTSFGAKEVIDRQRAERQQNVEDAERELRSLQKSSKELDPYDPSAVESYKEKERAAQKKYNDAVDKRDLSHIQRINKRLSGFTQWTKSLIFKLMALLKAAMSEITAYIRNIKDEVMKLIGEFSGGQSTFLANLIEKSSIVVIIQMVYALIGLYRKGKKACEEEEDVSITLPNNALESSLNVWTDDEGSIHIEDTGEDIQEAIEEVLEAFGEDPEDAVIPGTEPVVPPPGTTPSPGTTYPLNSTDTVVNAALAGSQGKKASPYPSTKDPKQRDKGNYVTDARQKLKSLIQLTGDPVLDAEIARTTEAITSRMNVTFNCPLQTSVYNAAQVNKWIEELNQQ